MLTDVLKDITVVNKLYNKENKDFEYKINYIKAFWSSQNNIGISNTNLVTKDVLKVFIFDYTNYLSPKDFQNNYSDGKWTLQNDDYLVKGIVDNIASIADLKEKYECMKITGIANKDYGTIKMQHFEVSGE